MTPSEACTQTGGYTVRDFSVTPAQLCVGLQATAAALHNVTAVHTPNQPTPLVSQNDQDQHNMLWVLSLRAYCVAA
jgi:hypothetical protein